MGGNISQNTCCTCGHEIYWKTQKKEQEGVSRKCLDMEREREGRKKEEGARGDWKEVVGFKSDWSNQDQWLSSRWKWGSSKD